MTVVCCEMLLKNMCITYAHIDSLKKSRIDLIRLVIYCRNLRSNLRRNYGVEFYLAKLLISSRNRGVECTSNVDRIQVPTVDDQP